MCLQKPCIRLILYFCEPLKKTASAGSNCHFAAYPLVNILHFLEKQQTAFNLAFKTPSFKRT